MTTTTEKHDDDRATTSPESIEDKREHAYRRHCQMVTKAIALNKAIVFDALAAAGITAVTVDFDGEGDNGQIESIAAHAGDHLVELPATTVTTYTVPWDSDQLSAVENALNEALEEMCYAYLAQEHGGWENNDGAYGEFRFDVRERTLELEFNARYTDVFTDLTSL